MHMVYIKTIYTGGGGGGSLPETVPFKCHILIRSSKKKMHLMGVALQGCKRTIFEHKLFWNDLPNMTAPPQKTCYHYPIWYVGVNEVKRGNKEA